MEGRWPRNETPTDLVAVGDEEQPEQSAVEGHCLHTSVGDVLGREKQVSCTQPLYLLSQSHTHAQVFSKQAKPGWWEGQRVLPHSHSNLVSQVWKV